MPSLEINGVQLAFEDRGSGTPVVLVHGWGGSKSVWNRQIPALAPSHRVIALDLRGHGDSGRPIGDRHYSPAACAADIGALMDALDIPQAVLVGLSMGTLVSQLFCLAHPARVKALVLAGALAGSPPAGVISGPWVEGVVKEIETRGISGYLEHYIGFWFSAGFDPAVVKSSTAECYKLAQHAAIAYCGAVSGLSIRDRIGEIRVPTLLMVGSEDGRTPVEESEWMNRRIPDAWLRIVKGAGHLANIEQPETFNRALLAFLNAFNCHLPGPGGWSGVATTP